ncbi:MAG: CBS domain-containing protein [Oscillospiraceae bacterium]|jgi:CBS domain-containing protein
MKISELMTDQVVTVSQDEAVTTAARLLKRHNVGALPVCDGNGKLRGIVTDRDIVLRCIAAGENPHETRISEIMSRSVVTASTDDSIDKAARLMSEDQIRRLPIMDNGKVVGMVALGDMARNCTCGMEAASALSEISSNIRRR